MFPGGKVDPEDWPAGSVTDSPVDELAAARAAAVREAAEEAGVAVEPDGLVWFAHWTPPPAAPKRFATWFFVAPASEAHDLVTVDGTEITEHAWLRPSVVLERHTAGEVDLAPPTWLTLHRLTAFSTAEEAVAEYGIHLMPWEEITNVDALILAVAHTAYLDMGAPKLLAVLRAPSEGVLIDVKACLDPKTIPPAIAYWRL